MAIYRVEEMSCGHCVSTIEKAVSAADPEARVSCDLGTGTVEISGARDEQTVLHSIRDAGYEPVAV